MQSKFITSKSTVNIKDEIFNYSDLYMFLKKTLEDRGYYIEEKSYTHNNSGDTEIVGFYWNSIKKVDDFTKYLVEFFVRIELIDVVIEKDKKKEKSNRGSGSIKIKSTLVTDYAGKWEESNPIITFIKVVFENIFQKGSVDEYTKKLTQEAYEIENEIKSYFNVQRML
jgi:hypothetical protein